MKSLFFLIAAVCLVGCTTVGVRGYLGKPLDKKESSVLVGRWLGGGNKVITVSRIFGSSRLIAKYSEAGKTDHYSFLPTRMGQDCIVLWVDTREKGFFIPIRTVCNDSGAVLFTADLSEVKSLVKHGVLHSSSKKSDDLYLIEAKDLDRYLESQAFWDISSATPLLRK